MTLIKLICADLLAHGSHGLDGFTLIFLSFSWCLFQTSIIVNINRLFLSKFGAAPDLTGFENLSGLATHDFYVPFCKVHRGYIIDNSTH